MECIKLRKLNDRLALRKRRIKPKYRSDRWHKIGGFQRAIDNHTFTNTGSHRHHPCGPRERIARAVMLKSIAAGIFVGVAAKVRQYEQSRVAGILRLGLDRLPKLGTKTICAADALNIERIRASMRDIDIVQ